MSRHLPMLLLLLVAALVAAPWSHALSSGCCGEGQFAADLAESDSAAAVPCCCGEDADQPGHGGASEGTPTERDSDRDEDPCDGGCDCPLRCCASAGAAGVQLPPEPCTPTLAAGNRVGRPRSLSTVAREATADLMRPPRS